MEEDVFVFIENFFWDVLSLRETGGCSDGARRQREEGGGLVQYAAPAYRLPSTEIAYAAPPPHDMQKVDQYCHQQKGKSTLLLKLKRSASRESALFRMLANMLNEIMQIVACLIGSPNLSQARLYVVKEMWRRRRQYFQGCRDNHEVLCGKAYEA